VRVRMLSWCRIKRRGLATSAGAVPSDGPRAGDLESRVGRLLASIPARVCCNGFVLLFLNLPDQMLDICVVGFGGGITLAPIRCVHGTSII